MTSVYQTAEGTWRASESVDGQQVRARGKTREEAVERLGQVLDSVEPEFWPDEGQADDDEDYAKLYSSVQAHIHAENLTDKDVTSAEFDWGQEPVGLLLWSDWHVGSRWTDYDQLLADVEYVAAYRQEFPSALHLAHLGDLWDNFTARGKHPSGQHEQIIARIDKQKGLAVWLAQKVAPWDVMLYGCHPAWDLTQWGTDTLAPIAEQLQAVHGGYGLDASINVGTQTYRVIMRHKGKSEGGSNPAASGRTTDNEYVQGADVIALSHRHECDLQVSHKAGRPVTFVRAGGYKGGDCFARAGAFTHTKDADCGVPLLIFDPVVHSVLAFDGHHWKEGLDVLARLRTDMTSGFAVSQMLERRKAA